MTIEDAKEVLRVYRSDVDEPDTEIAAALALAEENPALAEWWEREQAVDRAITAALTGEPVPDEVRISLLATGPGMPPPRPFFVRRSFWMRIGAAAAIALLITGFVFRRTLIENQVFGYYPGLSAMEDEPTFRAAMASYISGSRVILDLLSNDPAIIRGTLAGKDSLSYEISVDALGSLDLIGCKTFQWQHHPVALICFELPENRVVHLFIRDRAPQGNESAVDPGTRLVKRIYDRSTAAWSEGGREYVLVGSHPDVDVAPFVPTEIRESA